MERQMVIARFAEDIKWSLPFKDVVVYNKGATLGIPGEIDLPNCGREAHTYLYHICQNYDQLADITLFCQGHNDDHCPVKFPLEKLYEMPKEADICGLFYCGQMHEWYESGQLRHSGKWARDVASGHMRLSPMSFVAWWQRWVGEDLKPTTYIGYFPGAVFAVRKEAILRRPLEYYKRLIGQVGCHGNPEEAYFMERAWTYIWQIKPEAIAYVTRKA